MTFVRYNYYFLCCSMFIALFALFCCESIAGDNQKHVAIVKVSNDGQPGDYYDLIRDGKSMASADLTQNMKVYNGDILQPKAGKEISAIIYVYTKCATLLAVSKEVRIHCTAPKK